MLAKTVTELANAANFPEICIAESLGIYYDFSLNHYFHMQI